MNIAFLHVEDKDNNPQLQRRLAQIMVDSVKRVIPEPWLIQMTDMDTPVIEGVDETRRLEPDYPYFMNYRLRHLMRLKCEVLILDTDTVVLQNPAEVFNHDFDVCLTRRDKQIISTKTGYTEDDPLMVYNTGVMFSRNPAFWCDALTECRKLEERHQKWFGDQIAVVNVVNQRKYDIAVIKCDKWNYTPQSEDESLAGRGIVHFQGGKKKQWMLGFEKTAVAPSMMDPYSTHLEALVKTALETTGGILELGCGNYSTPILSAIAKVQGRKYVAQSSNQEWASRFNGSVEVISWDSWTPPRPNGPGSKWGMVFMDSDEHTWDRVKRIPALAEVTDTIVLHDADVSMKREAWPQALAAYPDITIFDKYKPWTAVMRKSC